VADDIRRNWGDERLFVDLALIEADVLAADDRHPLELLLGEARNQGLSIVPVIGLQRSSAYQGAVASAARLDGLGACFRLRGNDLDQPQFPDRISELLSALDLDPSAVDLLVDLGMYDQNCPTLERICRQTPALTRWRTFTVVAGSFPKDLSGFAIGQHLLPRRDWRYWRDQVTAGPELPRVPSYGDYTIQHPIFSEPPPMANFSASIRYTTVEDWVIMRGEGVRNDGGPGYAQWPANAELLCGRQEFCGADFSDGDRYIRERSILNVKTGNAETWLRAGINHHLTFVVRQIANVVDSVAGAERDLSVDPIRSTQLIARRWPGAASNKDHRLPQPSPR
jgi:hypothetical protein